MAAMQQPEQQSLCR